MMTNGGYGIEHLVFSLVWFAILVVGIVFVVRMVRGGKHMHGHWCHHEHEGESALTILKERYAKGEIDKAEFETKKKDLS